jgi:lipid II:glycine glycyltransferase (peptidoglycan interpeptide bridge formation enzyme)
LNCITRKRHGLPPQPKEFFNNIYKYIISQKKGFIVLASINNLNIAGGVYFHLGNKAIYKYGASIPEFNLLKANNIIMWEAIKWCCINNFEYFSFGRTDIHNNGLIQYKDGWGTEKKILGYIKYDLKKDKFITDSSEINPSYTKIFNKLPVPVLKLIGKYIYKHIG